jgi:hypothetical protein
VIQAGYNVHIKQYYNGSSYSTSCSSGWASAAAGTTAGAPVAMPVGTVISLGNGAKITCIARAGSIIGGGSVAVSDENDLSIALLIQYGGFDYLWASDLGGGSDSCTGRSTSQVNVETAVINAISPGGAFPLISAGGIDVLHVNHHGSESSTNPDYFNGARPAVAIIGVGDGETSGWDLPRIDVVDHVLLGASSSCVTAPPAYVLQTEEGNPAGTLTSHSGYCVGNITITTDGVNTFNVSADGAVHQGPNELVWSGLPLSFTIDDAPQSPDTTPPTTSITSPLSGATVSGTINVTANASDDRGVAKVEFYLDGTLQTTDTSSPYSWSWNTTAASNGTHSLTSKAFDAAGNNSTSAVVSVTVSNGSDVTPPAAPSGLVATGGRAQIKLSWNASTDNVGFTGYDVWRSTSATGTFSLIATTTSLTYTNSGLTRGQTFYYYVTARDAAGNVSTPSNTASAKVK